MSRNDPARDMIDELLRQWQQERPDLDASAMAVVGRILRLGKRLEQRANAALRPFGLNYSDLDVLATLRRAGRPYSLKPSQLQRSVLITSGAMTACLNRLEAASLLVREVDMEDRRVLGARLTLAGLRLVDRAMPVRFAEAQAAVGGLTRAEGRQLAGMLRKLEAALPD